MPPKGSKRSAPKETEGVQVEETGGDSLRRSTRGGGHKAPEAKPVRPHSTTGTGTGTSTKKAKTTTTSTTAEETTTSETINGNGRNGQGTAGVASTTQHNEPTADGIAEGIPTEEKAVSVPESNIEAAKHTEVNSKSGRIEVGDTLPDGLILKNEEDKEVTLRDLTKEKGAIFFIYPKANTPGCTTQACDFNDNYAEFGPLGYDVYGLSADSPKAQASWKAKHNFRYHLLCDPAQIFTKVLGAAKSGNAKSNQRSHYIVEKGGKLVDAKYAVSPKDSCKLALDFIKGQNGKTE